MKILTNSGLLLIALSAFVAPVAVAQMEQMEESAPPDTRIEKYDELTETDGTTSTSDSMMYDVRRTEAFNLVSSAYRGQFEAQGINGYAVMISNYNSGELTAEDLINAAIEAGELSPMAIEDESYIEAVELQLESFRNS